MLQGLLNLDGGVLLWIQEWVRSGLLTPLVTVYTHLGDSGVLWIALSVLLLCFKKTRKAGVVSLLALLLSLIFTNGILKYLVARTRPWLTVEGLRALAPTVTAMATAEGLDAHRRAVTIRLTDV